MNVSNINFTAVLSSSLLEKIKKVEFEDDAKKAEKFSTLFHDTFERNTDDSTEISVNSKNKLVFRNNNFPKVKHVSSIQLDEKMPAIHLIHMCQTDVSYNEYLLFQKIIRKENENGVTLENIENKIEKNIKNEERKSVFLELIDIAKKIKSEDKDAILDSDNFTYMINREMLKNVGKLDNNLKNIISSMGFNTLSK